MYDACYKDGRRVPLGFANASDLLNSNFYKNRNNDPEFYQFLGTGSDIEYCSERRIWMNGIMYRHEQSLKKKVEDE